MSVLLDRLYERAMAEAAKNEASQRRTTSVAIDLAQNRGRWKGRPFRIGAFDIRDGEVLEVHTEEEAAAVGKHHRLYFSPEVAEMLTEGLAHYFFVTPKKGLDFAWPPWWLSDKKHAPKGLPKKWWNGGWQQIPARVKAQVEVASE